MEETGCDEGQAILALESCNYVISKSISKIFDLLKNIVVVKSKFYTFGTHLYGMLTIIVDINHNKHLRTKALVTYNPTTYEIDLSQNWYEYEKKLYTARLISGSIPDISLDIESKVVTEMLDEYKSSFFSAVKEKNIMEVADILEDILREPLKTHAVNFDIILEELNLSQFKKITDKNLPQQMELEFNEYNINVAEPLTIDVICISGNGPSLKAKSLLPGDEILVLINDSRDIAQYLSGLLGGRDVYRPVAIPSKIQEVVKSKNKLLIYVRLAAGVIGKSIVSENEKIRVLYLGRRKMLINRIFLKFYLIFSKFFEIIKR
ncbi:MAG: hypothetical protein A2474_02225 [Elusimicrobia bacterium RIFOXYC2_FULL_34_12]|nr:MAG: hypothetical protein A2474_02225 [Elusimicrobia bacterium RIFOXYC2_FULL_34_12]OGS39041.1 MAG: hypothetical protein A2551_07410 [Elusimicrobia bacterium RIFOXYD2_FULL_34_30]